MTKARIFLQKTQVGSRVYFVLTAFQSQKKEPLMSESNVLNLYRKPDNEPFANLRNLFDGWFHQDFDIDGPDLETIIPKYAGASWKVDVEGTIDDIRSFLNVYGTDDETLHKAVESVLNPGIIVEGWERLTTREWLLRVARLLEGELKCRHD